MVSLARRSLEGPQQDNQTLSESLSNRRYCTVGAESAPTLLTSDGAVVASEILRRTEVSVSNASSQS